MTKLLKTSLTISANTAAVCALAWVGVSKVQEWQALDACAKAANVYACHFVATPIEETLLPPPTGVDSGQE